MHWLLDLIFGHVHPILALFILLAGIFLIKRLFKFGRLMFGGSD